MKLRFLPICLAVVAMPAFAQDRSFALFYDKAPGETGTYITSSSTNTIKPDDFSGIGFKFGVNVAQWGPATVEFNASYRRRSKKTATITPPSGSTTFQYEWGYVSAGADVNFIQVVDFGVGLDLRAQQDYFFTSTGSSTMAYGITRMSPWIRAHVGYTFDAAPVKPFVALELARDLRNDTSYDASNGASVDVSKAFGVGLPKKEYSLYAGIRF